MRPSRVPRSRRLGARRGACTGRRQLNFHRSDADWEGRTPICSVGAERSARTRPRLRSAATEPATPAESAIAVPGPIRAALESAASVPRRSTVSVVPECAERARAGQGIRIRRDRTGSRGCRIGRPLSPDRPVGGSPVPGICVCAARPHLRRSRMHRAATRHGSGNHRLDIVPASAGDLDCSCRCSAVIGVSTPSRSNHVLREDLGPVARLGPMGQAAGTNCGRRQDCSRGAVLGERLRWVIPQDWRGQFWCCARVFETRIAARLPDARELRRELGSHTMAAAAPPSRTTTMATITTHSSTTATSLQSSPPAPYGLLCQGGQSLSYSPDSLQAGRPARLEAKILWCYSTTES